MVGHRHGSVVSVVAPVRKSIMDGSVPGPASQGGDHGDAGDEGKGGHDLPPHPATEAEFWKS